MPKVNWKEWQNKPIHQELHDEWKRTGLFNDGMAIITGKVWHRKDREGYYVTAGDSDNQVANDEITRDLAKFAQGTLVEQCEDTPEKFHWIIYSIRPILNSYVYKEMSIWCKI